MTVSPSNVLRGIGIGVSVRLDYILFPIKFEDFRDALASKGYTIEVPRTPRLPIGTQVTVSGTIARKGDVVVGLDAERQVFGAEGKNLADVIAVFSELENIIEGVLRIEITPKARFYEILANYEAVTGQNPLQQISKIKLPENVAKGFEEILKAPVSNFTLHVSPVGQMPNQEDWFDIRIEPLVFRATDTYLVNVIYRNKDKSKFTDFMSNLETTIKSILDLIDK